METCSAHIEGNHISDNILANIALGGTNSVNTVIVNNKISGSMNEGIFCIQAENAFIIRNHLYQNNDGIVSIASVPLIQHN